MRRNAVDGGEPEFLLVEDAAAILRIGRTKAYALTRLFRQSGGRQGIPVVDLGHALRVPRRAFEERFGITLRWAPGAGWSVATAGAAPDGADTATAPVGGRGEAVERSLELTPPARSTRPRRRRKAAAPAADVGGVQLSLWDIEPDVHEAS